MKLKLLIGSGEKIGIFTLPFLTVGLLFNILFPDFFSVGGPSRFLVILSYLMLIPGLLVWIWSVSLILIKVPKQELITEGPYHFVRHPLYTTVAFLVLPWLGFIYNSWLGVVIGIVMYGSSRRFSPQEDKTLSESFGTAWEEYNRKVKFPWI
jgi:protein-S-isoprenylcysteine O-methyltransferase Ste14